MAALDEGTPRVGPLGGSFADPSLLDVGTPGHNGECMAYGSAFTVAKIGKAIAPLPALPIPSLESTCKRYVTSIEAVVDPYQYKAALEAVDEMKGQTGTMLQDLLRKRANPETCVNWLEEYWDDAYLATREPIPINVNSFFAFKPNRGFGQVERAASLLHAALEMHVQIRDGTLRGDVENNARLCMSQMRRVFCTSRVPGDPRDTIVSYRTVPLTNDEVISKTVAEYVSETPSHCVVIMRNRFYRVRVLDDGGAVLPLEAIGAAMATVSKRASTVKEPGAPVGLLTTMERAKWAAAYKELVHLGNQDHLHTMQSAILVVCLDSMEVKSTAEAARLFLHGAGTNRWFDRHNLIVAHNGAAGFNFEHSVVDAAATLRVANYMVEADHARTPFLEHATGSEVDVQEMHWIICRDQQDVAMTNKLKEAFAEFLVLIRSNETEVVDFEAFGASTIEAQFLRPDLKGTRPKTKMAVDAFVQIALQLTYYRLHGHNCATYQTASTRTFLHGRTSTVRSATVAALRFLEASSLPLLAASSGPPGQCQLLQDAMAAHVKLMEEARRGEGIDRHLLGLRNIALANPHLPFPAMLNDSAFEASGRWILSTAHCGSPNVPLFGFGPAARDGFGVGYMILDKEIRFTITCKYNRLLPLCRMFGQFLEESLLLLRSVCESAADSLQGPRPTEPRFCFAQDDISEYCS